MQIFSPISTEFAEKCIKIAQNHSSITITDFWCQFNIVILQPVSMSASCYSDGEPSSFHSATIDGCRSVSFIGSDFIRHYGAPNATYKVVVGRGGATERFGSQGETT